MTKLQPFIDTTRQNTSIVYRRFLSFFYNEQLVKMKGDGRDAQNEKVLFAALIASSFFLCQTVRADSSQPPSETSESQIQESQEPLDSSHTPPNEADPSDSTRWEKLEQQRKELEDTLEQAKQQLIEKQKEIDQTVNDLANQAVSDRDELAEKIAEEREKAELAKQK
ncbi:hypothetical protein SNF32_13865 [Enterococcus mundtii]|nr:hypothetical protein [Enterococcus mundtii]